MGRVARGIVIAIVAVAAFFWSSPKMHAQEQSVLQEVILSFGSRVVVHTDNSIDVVEIITYNTGPQDRHGIYRNVYQYSSQNRRMNIEDITVTDERGTEHPFVVSTEGKYIRIKIGDPKKTFRGARTYIIGYRATDAVAQLSDVDEIYWNVTGNDWNIPILQTIASVTLPDGTPIKQTACYIGPKGSTQNCGVGSYEGNAYATQSTRTLNAREGITVAVGFAKGVTRLYPVADNTKLWVLGMLLPAITLLLCFIHWYRKGNDPRGRGVIIPQYDVPDQLTPMEVAGIMNEKIQVKDISAEIIYLATKGYVKIQQIEKTTLGFIKSIDYELTLLKDLADALNEFDQKLLLVLFQDESQSIRVSALKKKFYTHVPVLRAMAAKGLETKGYYSNLGHMKGSFNALSVFMIISAGIIGFFGTAVIIGVVASIAIYSIASRFFPAKTLRGVETKEYLLGLREYLQIAEKDRLEFHNAPEKKPEVFQELLPYAMVLGVSTIWAKEFADIYMEAPSWYSGAGNVPFNSVLFVQSISSFNTFTSSAMGSTPGSSGGGSSGGGGGGGGGGGW